MEMKRYDKGVLLTLVTIVLLVLMVAELVTYVYITISYQAVSASGAVSTGSFNLAEQIGGGAVSLLHASLYGSINALAAYEAQPGRKASFVNNSAWALQSLILNGTIYGTSENAIMGGATISSFVNSVVLQAQREGYGLRVTNSTVQVYQTGPFALNVTYSAIAVINSSSGTFSYPISASSWVYLNGSPDLYSFQNGDDYHIKVSYNYPVALLIGNVIQPANNAVLTGNIATSGNILSSSFIYGPIVFANSVNSKCSGIPAALKNANYILATQDDAAFGGACGFGGVVTNVYNGPYAVPYLVYGSNNVFNNINNGTAMLLSGNSLSLLQISNISSAIYSGYYYSVPFAPSYLEWAQGNSSSRSPYGIYSFNLYNRLVASFSTNGISYISTKQIIPNGATHFSASVWFNPSSSVQTGNILQQGTFALKQSGKAVSFVSSCVSANSVALNGIQSNTWHNIIVVYNYTLGSNALVYVDGGLVGNGISCGAGSGNFIIGSNSFVGSLSNIQLYNISLSHYQVAKEYYDGIDGIAVSQNNLTGWWPLDGSSNDISGSKNNGNIVLSTANAIPFTYLYGYTGDPIYDGSLYNASPTSEIEGIYNCANYNQCKNSSLQHLYLGNASLTSKAGILMNESSSLGLPNAIVH